MPDGMFITGTDTGVGKTYQACQLIRYYNQQGFSTAALKPIASGGDDPEQLQSTINTQQTLQEINPIKINESIAPHIALNHLNKKVTVDKLLDLSQPALSTSADKLIIEGAGGWLTPLNSHETLADFAQRLGYPVILIVGMRLGCLNHALLTVDGILKKGLVLKGWVANCIDPNMQVLTENISYLTSILGASLDMSQP